ncbi:protein mono-ADP-ribosyltransferase PARP9 [Morone saxatilis]|uniref:protein mono-ADP-ribosyltransferase PARP9 n=1 Tax=Morone saxatilis TaxID=34816 RepID=UPI0015E20E3D|nr:protein mono-ADP-ribosyltransferase PARP9 [Morone saxatilis]XP_035532035.1 protein mono-ADP-ribosyltransferase PARP9 [Morone saxatilis]
MASQLDVPLHGSSVNIVRQCGSALSDVIQSKFGCVAIIDGVDFEGDPSIAQQRRPTVVPKKKCEFTLHAGVKVSVWKADLTNFPVEAVVNAANERLQHYGGLASALSLAGGPQIQQQSDDHTRVHGNLKTGDAIVTDAGSLPCCKIIHAVGPQLFAHHSKNDVYNAEPLLEKAIRSILDRVKENRLNTVAIPAISSGLFHYPLPQCADTIVRTVKRYYERSSGHHPKEIMLVNNDDPSVNEMEKACAQILGSRAPVTYSQATAGGGSKGSANTSALTAQIENVHVTLKTGCIEDQWTDVIVNTVYNRDLNQGLISKALLQKAGSGMQKEMYAASKNGNVIITKPYNLQCKEVYHTSCTDKYQIATQQTLYNSVLECLAKAQAKGYKSIAFPAIGTGGLGFNKKDAAWTMSAAVKEYAKKLPYKMDVYFVIFPSDDETFKAFEEQMKQLKQKASHPSSTHESERRDDFHGSRAPPPQITLKGSSDAATREAERWLQGLLFGSSGAVVICNNFIQHFGEEEHRQLSRLMKKAVSIEELFEIGRASIIVHGGLNEDVVVAGLQVEAMLCNIQRKFITEEESAMFQISRQDVSFERKMISYSNPEYSARTIDFTSKGLDVVKMEKVENATLKMLFDLKKNQLGCSTSQKMFQCIPAQFCEMVAHIGFHAEYAPPDDPACGEGIYFARTVTKAMEVWKQPDEYLHFVEAEVVTGNSCPGKRGLILPPAVGTDPQILHDSVSGGPDISVIFSGYQALPKYIITCKRYRREFP